MSEKRLIKAIDLPGITPGSPPTRTPEVTWLPPEELIVDEAYQRGVGEKGLRLIRRIVETFDWRRFKPPTAVWTDKGLELVDGQHSAIAAACHPDIKTIPVVVVEGADIKDRAAAFVGLNKDRLNVTSTQMHAAGVVAGDERAMQVEACCQAAGINILRSPPSRGDYQPRDTVAVRAIGDLIKRRGPVVASDVLKAVAQAELAPVTADAIKAYDFLLHDAEHRETFDPTELTKAIVALGPQADKDAGIFAAEHCVPKWRGLAAAWFKRTRRRKPRADIGGSEPSEPSPGTGEKGARATQPIHVVDSPLGNGSPVKGDPPCEVRAPVKQPTVFKLKHFTEKPSPAPLLTGEERRRARHYAPFKDGTL